MNEAEEDERISTIEWEAPLPVERTRYDWVKIAAQLRARPEEWAKVFEKDRTSIVNALRQGKVKALHPDLGFEVMTRRNVRSPVRICSLYLRYVPSKDRSE